MPDYKQHIVLPISLGSEVTATEAQRAASVAASTLLRNLLSQIMLRRTQANILKRLLPPRTDYIIYCGATADQTAEYDKVAADIKRFVYIVFKPD